MSVKVKLKDMLYITSNVYKNDTPSIIADRILRQAKLPSLHTKEAKEKR